jgi:hypothetical protein
MIASLIYTFLYLYAGVMTVRFLLPRHRPLNRLWLGMSLGLLEEMWLPAIGAMWFSFDAAAHVFGAVVLMILTVACWFARDRRPAAGWDEKEDDLLRQLLVIGIPLTILAVWLQYTHVMRADEAGNWHVGQSTYGDLPMHLSFITNLPGKKFPADYPFFPGARLSYPFLTDSLSSTFYLMGMSLQASTIIPAALMMALCYMGVMVLAREMTAGGKAVVLAALLFFLNGGLGFLYDFDMAGGGRDGYFSTVWERLEFILTGWYKTPTNQPDPNNLRWSNMICDMMVPQRTLLGGYCMVFPCIYLLDAALRPRKMDRKDGGRALILLAVWGGALPLIHTHSFLALGLMSIGAMVYDLIHGDPRAMMERRSRTLILLRYAVYGLIAIALAAPQLIFFTFRQALSGETQKSFLQLQFNWVNNPNGAGMRDLYLWFYIKNIGLPFIALILALFEKKPRNRRLFAMMLPIILAGELVRFQPNEYDNNKLFYLAWLLGCMIVADWCGTVWEKLKGMRGRTALAVFLAVVTFLSAGLTVWRECVSDYMAFSRYSVEAGEFARDETPDDAVYLTGRQHLNPVLSIAGKTIVCGPDLWLYWHGIDTTDRDWDIREFYEDPEEYADVLADYDVSYIYVSSYERSNYDVDEEALRKNYTVVFENPEAVIYKVPEG